MKKILFVTVLALLALTGCKVTYNTVYQKSNYPKLVDTSTVSKGGISITLSYIDINEYFKLEYTAQFPVWWGTEQNIKSTRHTIINLFYSMTVYNIEILNNTSHTLKLEDSRIALILPDAPEPIFALRKSEMVEMVKENELPCILFEMTQIQRVYPNVDTKLTQETIQDVVSKIIKEKSIISRTTEILPGMKVKGYLVFPYDNEKITNGIISFIDVDSRTDEAGNIVLKTRFDYKIAEDYLYVKREYSQEQREYSQFIPISEEEYNAATVQPSK
jgi:hypothetical protein